MMLLLCEDDSKSQASILSQQIFGDLEMEAVTEGDCQSSW